MANLANIAAITAVTLVAAYGLGRVIGPAIETEITIAAPAQDVWAVLADGAAYPQWNPLVKSMTGRLEVGETLNTQIQLGARAPMAFTPEVLAAVPNQELRWLGSGGVKGIFDGEHYFVLIETADGTTTLRHGEIFRGILAYPLFAMIGKDTRTGFDAMNQALKARVEAQS